MGFNLPVTVVALVSVNDDAPHALARYFAVTTPLLEKAGAKIVQRFLVSEDLVGAKPAQSMIIVEYPSREAVSLVFDSPEYQGIIEDRDKAFSTYQVSLVAE